MEEDSRESSNEDPNQDPEVRELQNEFSLPPGTATKWNKYIGDVESVYEQLGQSASEDYVDLVLKRERLFSNLHQRRRVFNKELRASLWEWRRSQRESLEVEPGEPLPREVSQEYRRRIRMVNQYFRNRDKELIRIKRELAEIDKTLCDVYNSHLEGIGEDRLNSKKDKIIELKRSFPYLRANNDLVAIVVDTTRQYAQQIEYLPGEGIRDRQVPTSLRNQTLERDDNICVRCGATDDLEAHHIIPRNKGGEDTIENMATLCSSCHVQVHNSGLPYDDADDFWESWANANESN